MRLLDKEVAVSEAVSVRGQPYTASVESIMNLDINWGSVSRYYKFQFKTNGKIPHWAWGTCFQE